jgi:hypothetical protein
MEETPMMKTCGQCGVEKELTPEFYGVQTASADGFRAICRVCFSDNRSAEKMRDVKNLKNHDRIVKAAKKALEKPELLPPNQLHKMNQIVNGDEKKRAKLQAKIQEAHKAEEDARRLNATNPSLKLVQQHFGSPILLTLDEMRQSVARAKIVLANLTGSDDGPAVQHVEAYISRVGGMVEDHDEREAELAKDAQETLNESVCRRVIGRVHDEYLPQIRAAITAEAKVALREKIRARKKALLAMAKTATGKDKNGAERAVVAKAVADALEKLALMCYGAKAELSSDTLENITSRQDAANAAQEWLEKAEAERQKYWSDLKERDIKQWERESKSLVLQVKGDGHFAAVQRKSMAQLRRDDPAEYERRALAALLPRKVTQDVIVYVVMEGKREIFYWPDGRLVKKGEEITFDFRLRRWCLMPGPASIDLEPVTANGRQRMELNQHDDGSFHWEPEGSQGTYTQGRDGLWTKDAGGVSPWTKAEKITFQRAEPPASSAHIHLRHGKWFTQTEVDEAARADAANPPNLLPPLPRFAVADSLALPPAITARDREKDSKEPSVWKRWEAKQREEKEREAELLQGNQI